MADIVASWDAVVNNRLNECNTDWDMYMWDMSQKVTHTLRFRTKHPVS